MNAYNEMDVHPGLCGHEKENAGRLTFTHNMNSVEIAGPEHQRHDEEVGQARDVRLPQTLCVSPNADVSADTSEPAGLHTSAEYFRILILMPCRGRQNGKRR